MGLNANLRRLDFPSDWGLRKARFQRSVSASATPDAHVAPWLVNPGSLRIAS